MFFYRRNAKNCFIEETSGNVFFIEETPGNNFDKEETPTNDFFIEETPGIFFIKIVKKCFF